METRTERILHIINFEVCTNRSKCFRWFCPTTGLLLRMFMLLYDMEVIEEEAFVKWKEDVNDEHPGKGKSLFQV